MIMTSKSEKYIKKWLNWHYQKNYGPERDKQLQILVEAEQL